MNPIFKKKIYDYTSQIPKGNVATYGQIARLAGNPKASRVVGMYMRMNPNPPHIPCHRVVASDGRLTGYSAKGGVAQKMKLLKEEGVQFNKEKVVLKKSLWKK